MQQLKTTVINYENGIYGIDQQMVRAFLIVGTDRAVLLDTGAVRIDIKSVISDITKLPLTVLLTHGDKDHTGNLQDFSAAYICEKDMAEVMSQSVCVGVELSSLGEGEIIDIGNRKLKVIYTPGHTAGSVALLDEENKILFAGDTVSYGPVFMFGKRRNMPQYLETLKRLRDMKDAGVFKTVYSCHNVCPISADAVDELITLVSGIIDKTIQGVPANMPLPTDEKPLLAKSGDCMVLF